MRRGVGALWVAGVGLGEIMRMACSPLAVSALVRYSGAYRTLLVRHSYKIRYMFRDRPIFLF